MQTTAKPKWIDDVHAWIETAQYEHRSSLAVEFARFDSMLARVREHLRRGDTGAALQLLQGDADVLLSYLRTITCCDDEPETYLCNGIVDRIVANVCPAPAAIVPRSA